MHSCPRCTVPRGHMHAVAAAFGIIGGLHCSCRTHFLPCSFMPSGQTQTLPCNFMPSGQTQEPSTAPEIIGGGHVFATVTHSLPSSFMPSGQTQEPSTGPEIIGGGHAPGMTAAAGWHE